MNSGLEAIVESISLLLQENTKLNDPNEVLRKRLNTATYAAADLTTKIKAVESEKQSLITVIKLLREDCVNIHAIDNLTR